jgi:hypothetical protein
MHNSAERVCNAANALIMKNKNAVLFILFAVLVWLSNITHTIGGIIGHPAFATWTWDARSGIAFCVIVGIVLAIKAARLEPLYFKGFRPYVWPFLLLAPLCFSSVESRTLIVPGGTVTMLLGYGGEYTLGLFLSAAGVLLLWQWLLWLKQRKETPPLIA